MGIPFDLTMSNKSTSPSLDRIDNSRGYEKGNVNIVTRFENMGRGDAMIEDFKNFSELFEFKK